VQKETAIAQAQQASEILHPRVRLQPDIATADIRYIAREAYQKIRSEISIHFQSVHFFTHRLYEAAHS
jgi:hypothetical protein